jgi:hypothetical protein
MSDPKLRMAVVSVGGALAFSLGKVAVEAAARALRERRVKATPEQLTRIALELSREALAAGMFVEESEADFLPEELVAAAVLSGEEKAIEVCGPAAREALQ